MVHNNNFHIILSVRARVDYSLPYCFSQRAGGLDIRLTTPSFSVMLCYSLISLNPANGVFAKIMINLGPGLVSFITSNAY